MIKLCYIADPNSIHNLKWINYFAQDNHVIIICLSNIEPHYQDLSRNIAVYPVLPSTYPFKNILKKRAALKTIKNIVKKHEIEIIHSMYAFPNSFWAKDINFKNHVITTRGSDILVSYQIDLKAASFFIQKLNNKYVLNKFESSFNHAKKITCTSKVQFNIINRFLKDSSKISIVRTGVDESLFDGTQKTPIADKILIFSPRSMTEIYNIDIIIRAFSEVSKSKPELNIELALIDDYPKGRYSASIKELATQLGILDKITFLKKLSQTDMIDQYKKSHLVIMLPSSDGTPNSGIESMFSKTPLLLPPLDYDENIFNENTCWFTSSYSHEDVYQELINLISAYSAEEVDQKLLAANHNVAKQASLSHSLDTIKSIYLSIIKPS